MKRASRVWFLMATRWTPHARASREVILPRIETFLRIRAPQVEEREDAGLQIQLVGEKFDHLRGVGLHGDPPPQSRTAAQGDALIGHDAVVDRRGRHRVGRGAVDREVVLPAGDHRALELVLLGVPEACVDERQIDHPQPVLVPRQGGGAVAIVVAQTGELMGAAGLYPDIGGAPQTQVIDAQEAVALGVIRAAFPGRATWVVGTLRLIRHIHRIDRSTAQPGDLPEAIGQDCLGVGDERRPRRRQHRPALGRGQGVRSGRARQGRLLDIVGRQMEHGLHPPAQGRPALHMAQHAQDAKVCHAQDPEALSPDSAPSPGCASLAPTAPPKPCRWRATS